MSSSKKINPTDKHVGTKLRERRLQSGMTLQQLATTVNLTYQQVQKYETGSNRISASRLQEFADALKIEVSWFFESAPGNHKTADTSASLAYTKFIADQNGMKLMQDWAMLTTAQRNNVAETVRLFARGSR